MKKRKQKVPMLDRLTERELEELGGEPLEGSGFEDEQPDSLCNDGSKDRKED